MTLRDRLDRELLLLQARIESLEKVMLERYRVKILTLQAHGATEEQIAEFLNSDAGKFEWMGMVSEIKKAVANTISRAADTGYMVGYGNGA